jgi:hypothetical protein
MGSEEESARWFLMIFKLIESSLCFNFLSKQSALESGRRRDSNSGCRPWSRPYGPDSIL